MHNSPVDRLCHDICRPDFEDWWSTWPWFQSEYCVLECLCLLHQILPEQLPAHLLASQEVRSAICLYCVWATQDSSKITQTVYSNFALTFFCRNCNLYSHEIFKTRKLPHSHYQNETKCKIIIYSDNVVSCYYYTICWQIGR